VVDIHTSFVTDRSPDGVDILIVHDREQPRANVGTGLPQMSFTYSWRQGFLHEIVCSIAVPGERPGILVTPLSR
jgi:hypothetical protein